MNNPPNIDDYIELLVKFVNKDISVKAFEASYLKLFLDDNTLSDDLYSILNDLFYYVEDFCIYPKLRDEGDLTESDLLIKAKEVLSDMYKIKINNSN